MDSEGFAKDALAKVKEILGTGIDLCIMFELSQGLPVGIWNAIIAFQEHIKGKFQFLMSKQAMKLTVGSVKRGSGSLERSKEGGNLTKRRKLANTA